MRKLFLIVVVTICFALFFLWRNNTNPANIISNLNQAKLSGKNLEYRFYLFGVIPVGEAIFFKDEISDYQGQNVYHLKASAKLLDIYNNFFNASGQIDSYIDMQTLSPVLFIQKLKTTGKENANKVIFYDQKNNVMTLEGVARKIYPNTQDPLSLMYNLRYMNFSRINKLEMSVNTNQKNYIFDALVANQVVDVNDRKYALSIINGNIGRREKDPYHRSKITIVMLKQEQNIPIFIRVFASGALITAKLIEAK